MAANGGPILVYLRRRRLGLSMDAWRALPWYERMALDEGLVEEFRDPNAPQLGDGTLSSLSAAGFTARTAEAGAA